jgi:hypothetical protein
MKDYGGVVGNGIGAWQVGIRLNPPDAANTQATASSSCDAGHHNWWIWCFKQPALKTVRQAKTTTYALNWFLNSNARVMFNYSETKFGQNVNA